MRKRVRIDATKGSSSRFVDKKPQPTSLLLTTARNANRLYLAAAVLIGRAPDDIQKFVDKSEPFTGAEKTRVKEVLTSHQREIAMLTEARSVADAWPIVLIRPTPVAELTAIRWLVILRIRRSLKTWSRTPSCRSRARERT